MTREEAIERARKLMALGQSDNEHEAALAIAQAQRLLERFEIESADLGEKGPDEPMVEGSFDSGKPGGNTITWKMTLCNSIARRNGCTIFHSGQRLTVAGRQSDVRRVVKLYALIVIEVERITLRHCKGLGRRYAASFRHGCVDAIDEAIEREHRALQSEMKGTVSETALAIVDTRRKDAQAWANSRHTFGRSRASYGRRDSAGYAAGKSQGAGAYGNATRSRVSGGRKGITG